MKKASLLQWVMDYKGSLKILKNIEDNIEKKEILLMKELDLLKEISFQIEKDTNKIKSHNNYSSIFIDDSNKSYSSVYFEVDTYQSELRIVVKEEFDWSSESLLTKSGELKNGLKYRIELRQENSSHSKIYNITVEYLNFTFFGEFLCSNMGIGIVKLYSNYVINKFKKELENESIEERIMDVGYKICDIVFFNSKR
ncbi:hypothetical protein [Bacillus rhizoplanae]|uniref:hypothetical protein n=1 Tax=Bacillus rhizoplanae TaxID=2880966 RepID=UPI003D1A237B